MDKSLNKSLFEQKESSASEKDLIQDGDEFEMNLVEKSDVDLYEKAIDSDYVKSQNKKKPSENQPVNPKVFESHQSTAKEKDLIIDGDEHEMNLVEKSGVDKYQQNLDPEYLKKNARKK